MLFKIQILKFVLFSCFLIFELLFYEDILAKKHILEVLL